MNTTTNPNKFDWMKFIVGLLSALIGALTASAGVATPKLLAML